MLTVIRTEATTPLKIRGFHLKLEYNPGAQVDPERLETQVMRQLNALADGSTPLSPGEQVHAVTVMVSRDAVIMPDPLQWLYSTLIPGQTHTFYLRIWMCYNANAPRWTQLMQVIAADLLLYHRHNGLGIHLPKDHDAPLTDAADLHHLEISAVNGPLPDTSQGRVIPLHQWTAS